MKNLFYETRTHDTGRLNFHGESYMLVLIRSKCYEQIKLTVPKTLKKAFVHDMLSMIF
jgi:hypothetical protein